MKRISCLPLVIFGYYHPSASLSRHSCLCEIQRLTLLLCFLWALQSLLEKISVAILNCLPLSGPLGLSTSLVETLYIEPLSLMSERPKSPAADYMALILNLNITESV